MFRKIIAAAVLAAAAFSASAQTAFHTQRATLFDVLPVDSTDIVFLGNSLTNGAEWHELFDMPNIINRGISGDIASGVFARLDPVVEGKPAKIFLMIGVNDISHHITADSIATDIEAVVDAIRTRTPDTKLYLQSCLPFNESFKRWKNLEGKQPVIKELNVKIEDMAQRKGLTFINLYPLFSDGADNLKPEFTNDGLHLLGPAYLVWRDALMPYVKE